MMTFEELGLKSEIIKAVSDLGFETPTPIQEEAIPYILSSDNDLLAFAQTGTGKTAAFGLPVIHKIDDSSRKTQALVLCPTRELCLQISKDLQTFIKYLPDVSVMAVYGGERIDIQLRGLKAGVQIVVGTPGRTLDLIRRKKLHIQNIGWLILDEADEMLSMGFKDELDAILAETPEEKQILLFSATKQSGINSMVKNFMHQPHEIQMGTTNEGAANLDHHYYMVHSKNKFEALKRIVDLSSDIYGIIFCRTRRDTQEIADKLSQDGYNAEALHGDLSQSQRDYVMKRFRKGTLQLLVATDVAARGLDVDDLTHVINYHLPDNMETYIHRSGRTGRAGKSGIAIALINSKERGKISQLERKLSKKIERKMIPTVEDINKEQLSAYMSKVENTEVNESSITPHLEMIYERFESLSREELIQKFLSIELNRLFDYYKGSYDINIYSKDRNRDREKKTRTSKAELAERTPRSERSDRPERKPRSERTERSERTSRSGEFSDSGSISMKRFYLNVGKKNHLTPLNLIELINDSIGRTDAEIGKIEILRNFSFFELDAKYEQELLLGMQGKTHGNDDLVVEPTVTNKQSNFGMDEGPRDNAWKGKKRKKTKDTTSRGSSRNGGGSSIKSEWKRKGKKDKKARKV
ncbi:MAG: DEAD/DEAH box helicase [Chitinophagales bacterium]